jgi:hypothetical protein
MEKIKWLEKVTNEDVIERIGEKRTLLNNIMTVNVNWLIIFQELIAFVAMPLKDKWQKWKEEEEEEQLLDYLRIRRRYWELKGEAEDRKKCINNVYHTNIKKK